MHTVIKSCILVLIGLLTFGTVNECVKIKEASNVTTVLVEVEAPTYEYTGLPLVICTEPIEQTYSISKEDIDLIALVTMAEAEGECEEGKRLVIDTILNRVESRYFPDNVYDVIYQPNQFSSVWGSRISRCEVREDICDLVKEELLSRVDYDVVFFTAGEYSAYGVPIFQVENHYFSKYE